MAERLLTENRTDASFWREFPVMADYFGPGITPLLDYLGTSSKQVLHGLGEQVGKDVAAKLSNRSMDELLTELSGIWEKHKIGRLEVESRSPLVFVISNCTVCGQLQGTAEMYECAFHEGFFQGVLEARLGRKVELHQKTNYEGEAGTWCRRLESNVSV